MIAINPRESVPRCRKKSTDEEPIIENDELSINSNGQDVDGGGVRDNTRKKCQKRVCKTTVEHCGQEGVFDEWILVENECVSENKQSRVHRQHKSETSENSIRTPEKHSVQMNKRCASLEEELDQLRDTMVVIESKYIAELQAANNREEEANRRLSEIMSLRLRDNNPNVVDLSDQYRPTKLAEMMSELYDNQWTELFSYFEDNWEEPDTFSEEKCVQFLLNVVMEVYTYCSNKLTVEWTEAVTTILWSTETDEDRELSKMLKDKRKKNALSTLPHVQKDCLEVLKHLPLSDVSWFEVTSEANAVQDYLHECVRICWLMVVQDPPVYLYCPGWKSKQVGTDVDKETFIDDHNRDGVEDHLDENSQPNADFESVAEHVDATVTTARDISEDELRVDAEGTIGKGNNGTELNIESKSSKYEPKERIAFVKDHFKEYTKRGDYIDYVVWPVIFLHENGPLLGKGVAQGRK